MNNMSLRLPKNITLESLYQTKNQSMWFLVWILKKERFWPDLTREVLEAPFTLRRITWFISNQIKSLKIFKNNRLRGIEREWHKNGTLEIETNWKDGTKNGRCRIWYDNGQLNCEEYWKDNKHIDGIEYHFRKNGQLWYHYYWLNGQCTSVQKY